MNLVSQWECLVSDVQITGLRIFETAEVPRNYKSFSDEKVLALMLLARTLSNAKGALLLINAKQIVEARTIARCCFENLYWLVGLIEEGESFVRKMRDDEMSHRKSQGQSIFSAEVELEEGVRTRLQGFMKGVNQKFGTAKTLSPKHVASIRRDFEKTYIFYGQLSSDSAHPSVTALNRYAVPSNDADMEGIDINPIAHDSELIETLEYLAMAAMGVCVGVNQIVGGTDGGAALNAIADRYTELSNLTKTHPVVL